VGQWGHRGAGNGSAGIPRAGRGIAFGAANTGAKFPVKIGHRAGAILVKTKPRGDSFKNHHEIAGGIAGGMAGNPRAGGISLRGEGRTKKVFRNGAALGGVNHGSPSHLCMTESTSEALRTIRAESSGESLGASSGKNSFCTGSGAATTEGFRF
jgi:hypothetical protein